MLLYDDGAGDEHVAPVAPAFQIARAKHAASREVLAVKAHDLRPGRNTGDAIVERGPLLLADGRERRRLGGRKGQRAADVRRRGAVRIARAPEERAPRLAKRVERPHKREISQGLLLQANACRELIE